MGTWPLDLDDLIATLDDPAAARFDGLATGTIMGHVHLRVADVPETVAYYRDVLGFGLMAQLGAQAAFLSAGGYHHHFGANTWESRGAPPAPPGTAALRHATVVLPDEAERAVLLVRVDAAGHPVENGPMLRDPSGNRLALDVAA
jgi:catechol 2,3-dioxygenase